MKIQLHKWLGKAIIAAILLATPLSTYAQISAGNALSFDGDTDYVSLGNSAALEPTSTLTIELWVNPAIISDQRDLITSGIDGAGIKGYHLSIQNDGTVYFKPGAYGIPATTTTVSANEWTHIAATYEAGVGAKIYINGQLEVSSSAVTAAIEYDGYDPTIGGIANLWGYWYNGLMDEVRIWDDVRTAAEISTYYNRSVASDASNLVAYYKADESPGTSTMADETANANNRTLSGGTTFATSGDFLTTVAAKPEGNALSFDGDTDFINLGNSATLEPTSSLTLELWVNPAIISDQRDLITSGIDGAGIKGYHLSIQNDGKVYFKPGAYGIPATTSTLSANEWTHIAATYEAGVGAKIYINGQLDVSSSAVTAAIEYDGYDPTIGGLANLWGYWYNGLMDEIRIWDDVRTASEISKNYNQSINPNTSNLVAYYKADESAGTTTLTDASTNANDRTVSGGTAFTESGDFFTKVNTSDSGNSLSFDGTDDYVTTAVSAPFDVNTFTFETWVYSDNYNAMMMLLEKGTTNSQYAIFFQGDDLFYFRTLATGNISHDFTTTLTTLGIENSKWYHMAFTFDASTGIKNIYVNGILKATTTEGGYTMQTSPTGLTIGALGGHNAYFFNGKMDELRFWNVVQSAQDIQDYMNASMLGSLPGLLVNYNFNSSAGATVYDQTTNGYNGTMVNMSDASWQSSDAWHAYSISNVAGFRLLASPITTTYATLLETVWTQGATGSDVPAGTANVYTWNSTTAANDETNWTAVTDLSTNVAAGSGFLYLHFNDDDFDGTSNTTSTRLSVSGTENTNPTITLNSNVNGWTMVGNPFATSIEWSAFTTKTNIFADAQLYNPATSQWVLTSAQSVIAPFQAFFVKTFATNPIMDISTAAKVKGSTFLGKKANFNEIALTAKSGNFADEVMVRLNDQATVGLDYLDAEKLAPLTNTYLSLSIPSGTQNRAIESLPFSNEELVIPINFEFTTSGEVTFSLRKMNLPQGYEVTFIDGRNDTQLPVDNDFTYSFTNTVVEKQSAKNEVSPFPLLYSTDQTPEFYLVIKPAATTAAEVEQKVTTLSLNQNYPNPFNPTTTISFGLPNAGKVSLKVFDSIGRLVSTLVDESRSAGAYSLQWEATQFSSGMYFYQLSFDGKVVATKKMTLIK